MRLSSLLAMLALLCFSGSATAAPEHASKLSISPIKAVFSEVDRSTTYSLPTVDDDVAGAKLTYSWKLSLEKVDPNKGVDEGCNNHGTLTGTASTFVWKHGNKQDAVRDDGCDHNVIGAYGHQGLITVTVTDDKGWTCTATYKGTNSSDGDSVTNGVAGQPSCAAAATEPPPREPINCYCVKVLNVSLKSIDLEGTKPTKAKMNFAAKFACTAKVGGFGDCEVSVFVRAPHGVDIEGPKGIPAAHFSCDPECDVYPGTVTQKRTLTFTSAHDLSAAARAGKTFVFALTISCTTKAGGKTTHERVRLVFDKQGDVDRDKSDFNGDGKPDED